MLPARSAARAKTEAVTGFRQNAYTKDPLFGKERGGGDLEKNRRQDFREESQDGGGNGDDEMSGSVCSQYAV